MANKRATLKLYTKVIPANSQIGPLALGGTLFHVKESNGVFQVAFDDGDFSDCEVGIQFRQGEDFEEFKRVYLRNTTGASITAQIYIGTGRSVIDARLNTLVNRSITVSQQNADTYPVCTEISANTDFNGFDGSNKRKLITIQNTGASTIEIRQASGGSDTGIAIPTGQTNPIALETSGEIKIVVNGGTANILELFYSP